MIVMNPSTLAILSALTLVAEASGSPGAQDADARLDDFFKHYLEEHFRRRPLEATRLGQVANPKNVRIAPVHF